MTDTIVPAVDELAEFIRHIDGNNSMGAGALAESICERLAGMQPPMRLGLPREKTLRDEFAGQCLPHLSGWYPPETAAAKAYEYADAMIKERGEK